MMIYHEIYSVLICSYIIITLIPFKKLFIQENKFLMKMSEIIQKSFHFIWALIVVLSTMFYFLGSIIMRELDFFLGFIISMYLLKRELKLRKENVYFILTGTKYITLLAFPPVYFLMYLIIKVVEKLKVSPRS